MASNPFHSSFRAHAKINLGLLVTGKRSDGFHDICTVFHRIGLADEIAFSAADDITVDSTDPAAPSGETNICHAAARLLREELGTRAGVRISITKNIPVGAGLGGGSADAGAVLRSLPLFWGENITGEALRPLALRLGSDVPFFLEPDSALGRGRGEILEAFPLAIPYAILVCTPPVAISTAWAYAHIVPRPHEATDLRSILLRGVSDPPFLREHLINDFEPTVFREYPALLEIKESLMNEGALYASLSGSGSSLFGFFPDSGTAARAGGKFEQAKCRTFVTPPLFRPPTGTGH